AVPGQVGVSLPPSPASARGTATPRSSSPTIPRTAQSFTAASSTESRRRYTVFPPFVEGSACGCPSIRSAALQGGTGLSKDATMLVDRGEISQEKSLCPPSAGVRLDTFDA